MTPDNLRSVIQDKINTIDNVMAQELTRHQEFIKTLQIRKTRLTTILDGVKDVHADMLNALQSEGILDKLIR